MKEVLSMGKEENGPVYYPVRVREDGRIEVFGLPPDAQKNDYEIELATGEALKQLGDRAVVDGKTVHYVAVKKTKEVLIDERDWTDQGGVDKD